MSKEKKLAKKEAMQLAKPVVLPATNITNNSFRANWEPVDGAEGYAVQVFSKTLVEAEDDYTVLDEDFSGITEGSLLEPLGGDEDYVNLDDYDYGDNAGWSAYGFPNFVPSMVAGLLYSPYLNLTNNDGKYKVIITTYSNNGDVIQVVSHGKGDKVTVNYSVEIPSGGTGMYTKELEFDNGCEDLFFSVINNTAEVGSADYTDRIQVVQHLKKGDEYYKLVAIDESISAFYGDNDDIPVTYKTFTNVTKYADGATTLYYNVSAAAYNFGYDENNNFTYNFVTSPYSDYVKVDLENKTTEIVDDEEPGNTDEPVVGDGILTLGHFDGDPDEETTFNYIAFDGGNWYNAPMAFTYKNSGSQNIYLPEQLTAMKDKDITSISFSCFGSDAYYTDNYKSTAKIYVTEVDDTEFYTNPETDYLEWFDLDTDDLADTQELELDFLSSTVNAENITITFDLSEKPFHYTGKTLLVTVTNDSEQCLEMGEYVRFFWIDKAATDKNRSCIFVNDNINFLDNLGINKRITITDNYENINGNAPAIQFTYVDTAAGINSVSENVNANDSWYNLQGQRVAQPTKGIFIHNGKKYIIK